MVDRENVGGLSTFGARVLGFDRMCKCGHDEGSHDQAGRCQVFGDAPGAPLCACIKFTEKPSCDTPS